MERRSLPVRHRDDPAAAGLRVARVAARTCQLGPGARAVVWVQGCALRCAGCVVPESHARGGQKRTVDDIAERLLSFDAVLDGLTISGGEPMLQAAQLLPLIAVLRQNRPAWTAMLYTGYRLELLRSRGTETQRALLDAVDIVVDGPFVQRLSEPRVRWRGSANQRIHAVSVAGSRALEPYDLDEPSGWEMTSVGGVISWTGIPPAGLRDAEQALLGAQP
ncbi:MAG: 4Fe-4S single cluster domain-containing protein [Patulibacter sp.]